MNILNRKANVNRESVSDVLELTTGKTLESHAIEAGELAEDKLADASSREGRAFDALTKAEQRAELATAVREDGENLVKSVATIIKNLRS